MLVESRRASQDSPTASSLRRTGTSQQFDHHREGRAHAPNIKALHFLETPSIITAAEYLEHIVREGDDVWLKAASRNRAKT